MRAALLLWVAALAGLPLGAAAQTAKTAGTIVKMTSGDVACYLTLKDDGGATFKQMAAFEICERTALIGKRVALTYARQSVMADECQGNVDCKKTKTVMLVTAATLVDAKASTLRQSFCVAGETIVFVCRTGEKQVSVCASADAGRGKGTLQYRFGKTGDSETPELVLPEGPVVPAKAATGESVPFAGGGGAWLRFSRPPYAYTVYSGIGNWGPNGEKRTKEGVVVERAGKAIATLKCSSREVSVLGPDWFEKMGIASGNQDFEFPD